MRPFTGSESAPLVWPPALNFAPSTSTFMVNYRVEDLATQLQALREEGCNVLEKRDDSAYGKFGSTSLRIGVVRRGRLLLPEAREAAGLGRLARSLGRFPALTARRGVLILDARPATRVAARSPVERLASGVDLARVWQGPREATVRLVTLGAGRST